ncbi:endolytic transglycosylase MltG [Enterovirga aerilata]|uniref:Endolytic murein transglycosylase n=1 Tax=Enterovirga aerilata TaxID=2730920 RepID=A0A849IFD7_9HYPH|nr:endolytic transglycosylase MltG [Enterovirga sp. DB1703]NNM72613.1 endolytic transglycosylase MltG [Enterovirga sp. DB1703]
MFGRSKNNPTPPPAPSPAIPPAPGRFAPKSPNEALKPSAPPPPPPPRVRRPRGGMLSLMSGVMTLGLVIAAALVFGLLTLERQVEAPGPLAQDKVVLIPKGTGTSEMAELLAREGVITSPNLFELYAYLNRSKGQLKAGEFQFKAGTSIEDAIDTLIQGKAIQHALTIPEGLTSEQIVARLRDNELLTGTINEVPREGTLLPETYYFERGTSRQQLINKMQAEAREALVKAWAKRAPDLPIKTAPELVILASIVEKETGRADERPRVASVFLNRLAKRMKLQSDPTIVYGIVGGKGTLGRGILRSEIERATPYNTYVIEGLPPGPIANPGRAALEAVANPLKTRDLYFVADGTGGHAFAETLEQHNRNVARWRQIEKAREAAGSGQPEVDRVEPPPLPDGRTDLYLAPGQARNAAADPGSVSAIAGAAALGPARGFDASEWTERDPLRNQNWDLTSAKSVPAFQPPPGAPPAETAKPEPRKRQAAKPRRRPASAGSAQESAATE